MAKKFGIAWKLLAVCAAFALPIVVMFVLMTQAKLAEIEFTSKELQGDAFQRPLEDVFQHVSAHERLSARLRRGRLDPALEQRIQSEAREVGAALQRLEAADRAHGRALQFTPEGLGLRKRGAFTVEQLKLKWQTLLARGPAGGEQAEGPVVRRYGQSYRAAHERGSAARRAARGSQRGAGSHGRKSNTGAASAQRRLRLDSRQCARWHAHRGPPRGHVQRALGGRDALVRSSQRWRDAARLSRGARRDVRSGAGVGSRRAA